MRLHQLHIKNFRKIDEVTITFPKGLSVIVGENNAGKTTIIDALRLMLFAGRDIDALRLNENDFRSGTQFSPIEISCTFCDLNSEDEVRFFECLCLKENDEFDVRLSLRAAFNQYTRRVNVKMWGGASEGGNMPTNLYDSINTVYLKPLRDPESGLRPGRFSQVARLIDCLTSNEKHVEFESIMREANDKVKSLEAVINAKEDIDAQLSALSGRELKQNTELVFGEPEFHSIISGLHPQIDNLPFVLNGLGYNNLFYTATTLGTLNKCDNISFRSILIEEPEAHLHPQLQVLLLRHLAKITNDDNDNPIQIILSSHSPTLASQAPIDSIVSIHEDSQNIISCVSLAEIPIEDKLKKKLQRFLDATRAELLFARKIIMVEGIAEALLLPVLTRIAGGDLKDSSVTIVNVHGINFNAFIPLFRNGLKVLAVVLTDGDYDNNTDSNSNTLLSLKKNLDGYDNLKLEHSQITFEHELAKSPILRNHMLEAFCILKPTLGVRLKSDIMTLHGNDQKAQLFYEKFKSSNVSKGEFAQELALILETALDNNENVNLIHFCVPQYILNALEFLGIIEGRNNASV